MNTTTYNQQAQPPGRSWAELRGELSIYLIVAIFIGLILICLEEIQVRRQQMEITKRFHQVLEMHTDTIQQALKQRPIQSREEE